MDIDKQLQEFKQMTRENQLFTVVVALGSFFKAPVGLCLDENMDRECVIVLKDKKLVYGLKQIVDDIELVTTTPEV